MTRWQLCGHFQGLCTVNQRSGSRAQVARPPKRQSGPREWSSRVARSARGIPRRRTVGSMAVRSSSGMHVDRAAAALFPIVAAVSGRCHPHPRSGVGRAPRGFRRDPAGIDCLRGTTENWSGTSFDTNKRSCAFTYDHARRALFAQLRAHGSRPCRRAVRLAMPGRGDEAPWPVRAHHGPGLARPCGSSPLRCARGSERASSGQG